MKIYFSVNGEFKEFIDFAPIHILISNKYLREKYLSLIKDYKKGDFIFDSGAFTIWKTGGYVDLNKYIDTCNRLNDYFEGEFIAINLDVIPGKFGKMPTKQNIEESCELSYLNYLKIKKKYKGKLMPVFHQHDNYEYLHKYLDNDPYILGISPANDKTTEQRKPFLDNCFAITKQIRTHGLAVLSLSLLKRYPFYSVDAASYKIISGFGSTLFLDKNNKNKQLHHVKDRDILKRLGKYKLINNNYIERTKENIRYYLSIEKYLTKLWASRGIIWND